MPSRRTFLQGLAALGAKAATEGAPEAMKPAPKMKVADFLNTPEEGLDLGSFGTLNDVSQGVLDIMRKDDTPFAESLRRLAKGIGIENLDNVLQSRYKNNPKLQDFLSDFEEGESPSAAGIMDWIDEFDPKTGKMIGKEWSSELKGPAQSKKFLDRLIDPNRSPSGDWTSLFEYPDDPVLFEDYLRHMTDKFEDYPRLTSALRFNDEALSRARAEINARDRALWEGTHAQIDPHIEQAQRAKFEELQAEKMHATELERKQLSAPRELPPDRAAFDELGYPQAYETFARSGRPLGRNPDAVIGAEAEDFSAAGSRLDDVLTRVRRLPRLPGE